MKNIFVRWSPRLVWPIIYLLIFLMLVFSVVRTIEIMSGPIFSGDQQYGPPPGFSERYLDFPMWSIIHMATGSLFLILALLQFWKKFRTRHLTLHRWLGRFLFVVGVVSGATGILLGIKLPGFGGFGTLIAVWFFGLLFLFSLLRAVWCATQRQIIIHREWMIRAFAIALGVGTQRLLIIIFLPLDYGSFEEIFNPLFWLGTSLNLLIAEIWINLTRTDKSK